MSTSKPNKVSKATSRARCVSATDLCWVYLEAYNLVLDAVSLLLDMLVVCSFVRLYGRYNGTVLQGVRSI